MFFQLLLMVQAQGEPPAGELALLRWLIGILGAAVVGLVGIIRWLYDRSQTREDNIRETHTAALKEVAEALTNMAEQLRIANERSSLEEQIRQLAENIKERGGSGGL